MVYKISVSCLVIIILLLSLGKVLADVSSADRLQIPPQAPVVRQDESSVIFNTIALCESGNNPHATNRYSSASGRFQFLWSTWKHYGLEYWGDGFYEKNIFNYEDNTQLAWYVFRTYGVSNWLASQACWGI